MNGSHCVCTAILRPAGEESAQRRCHYVTVKSHQHASSLAVDLILQDLFRDVRLSVRGPQLQLHGEIPSLRRLAL